MRIHARRCIASPTDPSGSGRWESISAQDMLRRVAGLSKALAGLGIGAGDRVAIFAPNCPEWHTADLAIQGLGAVTVPIYFNESPERMIYILKDSGARIVVTAGESQARKVAESRAQSARHRACDFRTPARGPERRTFAIRRSDRGRR